MSNDFEQRLRRSHPEVSLRTAGRRLPEIARRVAGDRERVLLIGQRDIIACIIPLEDAILLGELEHRLDTEAGLQAIQAWEESGKRTSPVASLLARFNIRPRRPTPSPVAIASTADADLIALSEDQRALVRAISRLDRHGMVIATRRAGAYGEVHGVRIEGYRVVFLIEETRVIVLRIGAGTTLDLI